MVINKEILQSIISKYYLGGLCEAVKWNVVDKQITIHCVAPNKDMMGKIIYPFPLDDIDLAIFNTSQLNKLINITTGDLTVNIIESHGIATKLSIADSQFKSVYSLADLMMVAKVGNVTEPKVWDVEISLNETQILALIKAKKAMGDANHLVIEYDSLNSNIDFVFGEDSDYSNQITYSIPSATEINKTIKLSFNSDYIKEILSANIEDGKLYLTQEGLMKLVFDNSVYYLIKKNEQ